MKRYHYTGSTCDLDFENLTLTAQNDWYPCDTKDRFLAASKEHQDYWNLPENKISYNINKYGFRCDEFPEEESRESITFLGCSNTFGTGLPKERTWPYLVAKELNLKEINLGICAGSLDSAFRVYNEWQPIHKSKITCVFLPPGNRLELMWQKSWHKVGHWSFGKDTHLSDELLFNLLDDNFSEVNTDRNLAAIKYIAHETESKIVILNLGYTTIAWDRARDDMHPGLKVHASISNNFVKALKGINAL